MATSYKRIFLRWEVLRGWVPALLFAGIAAAIELFYLSYMVGRGLVDKVVSIPLGPWNLPVSIALMLSLGNVVVLLTLWMSVFEGTAYVRAGPDRQVRRILYPLRMVKVAALVLTPFTIVLFVPYVLVSAWFIGLAGSVPEAASFYTWAYGAAKMDSSTRFIISQVSAAWGAVVIASLQLWRVKGTRKLMLLLRRRRS